MSAPGLSGCDHYVSNHLRNSRLYQVNFEARQRRYKNTVHELHSCDAVGACLDKVSGSDLDWFATDFTDATFKRAHLTFYRLSDTVIFEHVCMDKAVINNASMYYDPAYLYNASLAGATLTRTYLLDPESRRHVIKPDPEEFAKGLTLISPAEFTSKWISKSLKRWKRTYLDPIEADPKINNDTKAELVSDFQMLMARNIVRYLTSDEAAQLYDVDQRRNMFQLAIKHPLFKSDYLSTSSTADRVYLLIKDTLFGRTACSASTNNNLRASNALPLFKQACDGLSTGNIDNDALSMPAGMKV